MSRLVIENLTVDFKKVNVDSPRTPRKYTLTHSDRTGRLFLTVSKEYDEKQISGLYTRFMRDEILAEWLISDSEISLHIYCHVGGGFILGNHKFRESIFRREMQLVLEAIRYGDRGFFVANPDLDSAPIFIHFQLSGIDKKVEQWGILKNYKI